MLAGITALRLISLVPVLTSDSNYDCCRAARRHALPGHVTGPWPRSLADAVAQLLPVTQRDELDTSAWDPKPYKPQTENP